MIRKASKFGLAMLAICMFLGGARIAKADTISVHDLSHNTATGVYTYTIQLDSHTDMRSNDGFVIYNFLGLTSWSLTGGLSTSQFTLHQTSSSNTLNDTAAVDAFAGLAALTNSIPAGNLLIDNLSFSFNGPTAITGSGTAVLTLTSSLTNASALGVYASVDHSGISNQSPFGNAEGPVTVPALGSGAPLPRSFWGGSLMFGLLAASRLIKNRAVQA
jgi:hypothetical protein